MDSSSFRNRGEPYEDKKFSEIYAALIEVWDQNDQEKARSLRVELKKGLTAEAWEYMTWQEWKEGLARYLENRIREHFGFEGVPILVVMKQK